MRITGIALILAFMMLICSSLALADQTTNTISIPLGYGTSIPANTSVFATYNINPPDNIQKVLYAILDLQGDYQANSNLVAMVNLSGVVSNCTPNVVATPAYNVTNYKVEFTCPQAFGNFTGGNVSFGFRSSKATTNTFGTLVLTYYNNPHASVALSGTEYQVGDVVKPFLQLSQNNLPLNNATCQLNIYYPNSTLWQTSQSMVYQNGSNGLYWWQGVAPNVTGVYMVDALCQYYYDISWAFSQGDSTNYPTNINASTGSFLGSGFALNDFQDGLFTTTNMIGGVSVVTFDYNFTNLLPLNTSNAILYYMGEADSGTSPVLTFQVYNWTSGTWKTLPNTITLTGNGQTFPTGATDQLVTNTIDLHGMVNNQTNIIRLKVTSAGSGTHEIFTNWQAIAFLNPTQQYLDNVRGGGELHITTTSITQVNLLNQILAYLQNTIYPYLQSIFNLILGNQVLLNTTINITNSTYINTQQLINLSQIINSRDQNISLQIGNLSYNISQQFNTTFGLIKAINITGSSYNDTLLMAILNQISATLNQTQLQLLGVNTTLNSNILSINQSLGNQITLNHNTTNNLILALNSTTQANFNAVNSYLANLTLQIGNNQNITQANITQLLNLMLALNTSTQQGITNLNLTMLNQFNTTNTLMQAINQSIITQINNLNTSITGNFNNLNANLSVITNSLSQINSGISSLNASILSLNATSLANYNNLQAYLNTLYAQASLNHNITQQNITQLNNLFLSLNTSLSNQITNLGNTIASNFTTTWNLIQSLNITANLTAIINSLSQISTNINSLNTTMLSMNSTCQSNYLSLQSYINSLSNQVSLNQNITQQNISQLSTLILALNTSTTQNINALNQSIASQFATDQNLINAINQSITSQIASLNTTMAGNFNYTWSLIQSLNINANISAIMNSLSQINSGIGSLNQSIINLNSTTQTNYNNLQAYLNTLYAQASLNHNITQQNITQLTNLYLSLNQSITQTNQNLLNINSTMQSNFNYTWALINSLNFTTDLSGVLASLSQINTNIGNLNTSLISLNATTQTNYNNLQSYLNSLYTQASQNHNITQANITQLANLYLALNQSITQVNQNVLNLNQTMQGNFNYTWGLINSLNFSVDLSSLQASLNQIHADISTLNTSILNLSQTCQTDYSNLQSYINALSVQVSLNHNITQQNISTLISLYQSLNTSLTTINTNIIYINQSVTWMLEAENVSTTDLNLFVQALPKCLYNTNWLATAQVRDRFGNILSPLDNVYCQMTTDLWATSNMTYSYLQQKWQFTHQCNPDHTYFNWSVDCERT